MGREVRRVPANWQHPKTHQYDHRGQWVERYEPLMADNWAERATQWDQAREKWERGEFPDCASDEDKLKPFDQWEGRRPYSADFMPAWTPEQATHLMMYEGTSEGTPISPAFATPEELAQWLVDNNASAFGNSTASYESWLRIAMGGWAPSMVLINNQVMSGVEAAGVPLL